MEILKANILYHSALADTYDLTQPTYKEENIKKVNEVLKRLANEVGNKRLVDLGCGTGFIINISKKYFNEIIGVDITPKMLEKVNLAGGNIKLLNENITKTTVESESADICTAYGVLHHLENIELFFKEAYRILRTGGVLYTDLDPNAYYWDMIKSLKSEENVKNEIFEREISAVKNKNEEISLNFNISEEVVMLSEFHKEKGFREEELKQFLHNAGFKNITIQYHWYFGQYKYIENEEKSKIIEEYMQNIMPVTKSLFKYLAIYAEK